MAKGKAKGFINSLFSASSLKTVILSAVGVVVGGLGLYYGTRNNVPLAKEARKGFDA